MTTNMVASATPLDHSLSLCSSFSILCANAQSALLPLSASTLLILLSPDQSLSCPTLRNTVKCAYESCFVCTSSLTTWLSLSDKWHRPTMEPCMRGRLRRQLRVKERGSAS